MNNIRKIDDMRLATSLIVELNATLINIEKINNSNYFSFVLSIPENNISKLQSFINLFYKKKLKVEAQRFAKTYNYLFSNCKNLRKNYIS